VIKESLEERERRKERYIERLRINKFKKLFEPLKHRIGRYLKGEIEEEDVLKTVRYVAKAGDELKTLFKKRTDVILAGISMEENRYVTEINGISVKLRQGDITLTFADAVINPASSTGRMERGLAKAIREAAGGEVEEEAVSKAPITAEKPIYTSAGNLPLKCIIHVATMEDEKSSKELVLNGTTAALSLAEELDCEALAIPGLGTGAGGIAPDESAEAIIQAIKKHKPKSLKDIILIDMSEPVVEAFERALEIFDEEN